MDGLAFTINRSAELFDEVPGRPPYRLARSYRTRSGDQTIVPRLRIIFRVLDDDRIELCAISAEG